MVAVSQGIWTIGRETKGLFPTPDASFRVGRALIAVTHNISPPPYPLLPNLGFLVG